ncbi:MAG: biopolymer transporter ExbD [Verrucomicrobia bacterium]|nr:biopolymer transporter ExbD [Kiritimatiellia bacterium]MCP5488396.1 biopolymer transporter ExbD [Verrucomicrobiota bacterium]
MKMKRKQDLEMDVDMTPMIDCVFLLLIFFMCVASMSKVDMTPELELPVAPKAAVPEDLRARGVINILPLGSLTGSGEEVTEQKPFMVSGSLVDDRGLKAAIGERLKAEPELRVYMRIDRNADFKLVRRAIKACAEVGVFDVIFGSFQSSGGG